MDCCCLASAVFVYQIAQYIILGVGNAVLRYCSSVPQHLCRVGSSLVVVRRVLRNMETVALHDFHATANDELSFKKNAVLKVLDTPGTGLSSTGGRGSSPITTLE